MHTGIVFANQNRNNEAINDFNKAIELKPDYAVAYNNRGMVYANERRREEAIRDFDKELS
jgi:Flp pilus assembly protein TadD